MRVEKLLLSLSALAAASALAQAPVATVTNVSGVATVTTGASGAAVVAGAPLASGSRVITTSSGSVTLRTVNGCTVTVPPAHGVTVLSGMTCQQLAAGVQPVTTTMGQAGSDFRPNPGLVNGVIGASAALIAIGILRIENDDDDAPLSGR